MLIRSAHSANIKERRDASTALFDPGRRDGDAGRAHPRAPRRGCPPRSPAVVSEDAPPRRLLDPQRPVPRRHPPGPDITVDHPDLRGRRLGPARRGAGTAWRSPPTAPTTPDVGGPTPGSMPADSHTLADEGVVIEPQRARRRPDRRALCADAPPRSAPRRPARPARRGPRRRPPRRRAARPRRRAATLRAAFTEVCDYAERRTRACLTELPDGERSARDVLETADGELELVVHAVVAGDELAAGTSPARPASTTATSTARWRSPALPVTSRCGC